MKLLLTLTVCLWGYCVVGEGKFLTKIGDTREIQNTLT